MPDTGDSARELAQLFAQVSQAVDNYLGEHFQDLQHSERRRLRNAAQQLDDIHDRFTAIAIEETLKGIEGDLNQIEMVTSQARQSLQRLKTTEKVLSVASAVAEVGTAALSGNPAAVAAAVTGLSQLLLERTATARTPAQA